MSRYDDGRRRGNPSTSSSSSKMRMDTSIQSRNHGERDNTLSSSSSSSNKRKELDNVMRKARESQSSYWNKKLLEVEERDPNRWRHSGYKELYIGGNGAGQSSSSNDLGRNHHPRSPRSPRPRSPHSPRPREIRERTTAATTTTTTIASSSSHNNKTRQARSPSSGSTCSDKSCSVCSPRDNNRYRRTTGHSRSRSRSPVTPIRQRHSKEVVVSSSSSRQATAAAASHRSRPRSPPPMPRPRSPPIREAPSSSSSTQQQLQQQQQLSARKQKEYRALKEKEAKARRKERAEKQHRAPEDPRIPEPIPLMRRPVKIEKTNTGHGKTTAVVSHPVAESSGSEDSDSSSNASQVGPPKMTLSERFGKMAQWSVDRRDMENMRITKDGENAMKVVIEGEERIARLGYDSPPPGHYPESLLAQGPRGLDCWDDVRVRYDYYKARGYLRDLTLDDYVKWEEWWYKYQEWLEAERYYEQWATSGGRPGGGRKRRGRRNNANH